MASLIPCSQCQRHVRSSEAQCPFCGAPSAPAALPARDALLRREAKRATLIALGLALAGQACGGKEDAGKKRDDVGLVPPYGIGPIGEPDGGSGGTGGSGGGSSGEGGAHTQVPPYGGTAFFPRPEGGSGGAEEPDAASPDDAGRGDAGVDDAGNNPDAAG
jgi:hypothetical protein